MRMFVNVLYGFWGFRDDGRGFAWGLGHTEEHGMFHYDTLIGVACEWLGGRVVFPFPFLWSPPPLLVVHTNLTPGLRLVL